MPRPQFAPDFLVIGAQKSGTTTLLRLLQAHHDVWAPEREVHYFSYRWAEGEDWYVQQVRPAADLLVGEKSPSYLSHPEAAARIATVAPAVRLIAILRDPVDRAYSHYWHNRRLGREPMSFGDAIEAEEGRIAESKSARDAERVGYVTVGRYEEQLARFDQAFGPDQLLVILHEDLRDDGAHVSELLTEFLGLKSPLIDPGALPPVHNAYVEYRSTRARRMARKLPRPVAGAIYRLNSRKLKYEPMDPGVRRELAARFVSTRAAISTRLGRELCWVTP